MTTEYSVREATTADLPQILALLREAMDRSDDKRFDALFRWKHLENPFGPSPMWVATAEDDIVAVRALMRWEFERQGEVRQAVRAVDTATHPSAQGKGLFTRLTMTGVDQMTKEGVAFVFNTPNDKSRPGYLKMGWVVAGRVAPAMRPTKLSRVPALRGARAAAEHWSLPLAAGTQVEAVLADAQAVDQLLDSRRPSERLRTRLSVPVLRWRYGGDLLGYRAVTVGDNARGGLAFVRLRRRGSAREAVLAEMLVPRDESRARRRLVREVMGTVRSEADYVLALGRVPRFIPVSRLGPVLTTRGLAYPPPLSVSSFALTLGDIELF